MIILLIIIGYIASVFICRWLNKIAYKMDYKNPIIWFVWVIPVINTFMISIWFFGIIITAPLYIDYNKFFKWFKGDNW